jgi:hypothetical protein
MISPFPRMISTPFMVLSKSPYLNELLSPLVPANLYKRSSISSIPQSYGRCDQNIRCFVGPGEVLVRGFDSPTAHCDVWQFHDYLWQQPFSEGSIHKLVHRNVWLNKNSPIQLVELQNVVKGADVDDLVSLARRMPC